MRKLHAFLVATALVSQTTVAAATPFINEFHYDNASIDTGEFIELAGGAGFNLSGWSIGLYNGVSGNGSTARRIYNTTALSGTFTNQSNGWGFLRFDYPVNGIQNGGDGQSNADPDGIALLDGSNNVVQFLSYEGAFTALDGPAAGRTSADIGVREAGADPAGLSLRLTGTQTAGTRGGSLGSQPNGFSWAAPAAQTPGALNQGQVFTQAPPPPPPPPPPANDRAIAEIQGAAQTSPLAGQAVSTTGFVTQVVANGYYLISDRPDANLGTSEGLFVFTGNGGAKPAVGDLVRVGGNVSEFLPGGNTNNTTITQLSGGSFVVTSSNNTLPAATIIGAGGRTPPTDAIETSTSLSNYDPVNAGRDFYESLEGMQVTIQNATAVARTVTFSNGNREVWVRSDAPATGLNSRGGLTITPSSDPANVQGADFNPERIQIDAAGATGPLVNQGDVLGNVTGVLSYDFGSYEVIPATVPTAVSGGLQKETGTTIRGDRNRLTYADYNVENLGNGQGSRYAQLAQTFVNGLNNPDVIGLQELLVVADGGAQQNVAQTLQGVVDAIVAAGGPRYQFAFLPPQGALDDRITNAYLYNPDRVDLVAGSVQYVPGVTDPASPYNDARGPLVARFLFNGQEVTTINNHWSSRGGSQPLFGANQPPANASDPRRQGQGEVLNAYVQALLAADPDANIIVGGDLNSFYFENPQLALRQAGGTQVLFGLYELLALNERYNYSFDGNAQLLDYIYASASLFANAEFDILRINSEFLDQFSDHDPLVASFLIEQVPAPAAAALLFLGVAGIAARRRRRAA